MEFLNASDAQREFSDLLIKAQHAPVAVVLSAAEYDRLQAIKEQYLQTALQQGIDDVHSGKESRGEDVIKRLRERI